MTDNTYRSEPKKFWATLPGLFTGLAAVIAAVTGLLTFLYQAGIVGPQKQSPAPGPPSASSRHADGQQSAGKAASGAMTNDRVLGQQPIDGRIVDDKRAGRGSDLLDPARSTGRMVRSDPPGADVYLDWQRRGQTPVTLENNAQGGVLVVTKEGFKAAYQMWRPADGALTVTLNPDVRRPRTRMLLLVEGTTEDPASLRVQLVQEGLSISGEVESQEFTQQYRAAGGLTAGLRAWARSRFDTDLLMRARVVLSSREVSGQIPGNPGAREVLAGIVRSEAVISLEIIDLVSGDQVAAGSGQASAFGQDRAQSVQKAVAEASSDSTKLLARQFRR